MPEDSINTLVGTFSGITTTISNETMSQCICIDTSNNRIGINTLDPSYAIDISNVSTSEKSYIRTPRLIISDISRLTIPNNIINSTNILSLISGEIYVDASNYLRLR
jgi:hypothetical protein